MSNLWHSQAVGREIDWGPPNAPGGASGDRVIQNMRSKTYAISYSTCKICNFLCAFSMFVWCACSTEPINQRTQAHGYHGTPILACLGVNQDQSRGSTNNRSQERFHMSRKPDLLATVVCSAINSLHSLFLLQSGAVRYASAYIYIYT